MKLSYMTLTKSPSITFSVTLNMKFNHMLNLCLQGRILNRFSSDMENAQKDLAFQLFYVRNNLFLKQILLDVANTIDFHYPVGIHFIYKPFFAAAESCCGYCMFSYPCFLRNTDCSSCRCYWYGRCLCSDCSK